MAAKEWPAELQTSDQQLSRTGAVFCRVRGAPHRDQHTRHVTTAYRSSVSACRAAWHSSTHHPTAASNRCSRRASNAAAAAADTVATTAVQQWQPMLCASTARLQRSSCGHRSRQRAGGRWWQQWLLLAQQRRSSSCQGPGSQCGLCNSGPCQAAAGRADTSTTGATAHACTDTSIGLGQKRRDSSRLFHQIQIKRARSHKSVTGRVSPYLMRRQ